MPSDDTDLAARVARGIALLDERIPGWRDRIDAARLDMREGARHPNGCGCIGAQLCESGNWSDLIPELGGPTFTHTDHSFFMAWAAERGLTITWQQAGVEFEDLTAAWYEAIQPATATPQPQPQPQGGEMP